MNIIKRRKIWFISDTHHRHAKCLDFKTPEGTPLRPFSSVEEMDATILENIAKSVKPGEYLVHLGDFAMKLDDALIKDWRKLPGRKRIIWGNHDNEHQAKIIEAGIFQKTMVMREFTEYGILASHIPVNKFSLYRHGKLLSNVHGHLHSHVVPDDKGNPDPLYLNVCVEHTSYAPIELDEVISKLTNR